MKEKYFSKYLKQPGKIPDLIQSEIESRFQDKVVFYAYSDIDRNLELSGKWVIVGNKKIYVSNGKQIRDILLAKENSIVEEMGIVANTMSLKTKDEIIETFWFSQKQSTAFAQLKFILEEMIEGNQISIQKDATEIYQETVLKPLLAKQSGDNTRKDQVTWRLLGYLKPYKKEVFIGSAGAICTTVISLLPAYISGKLVDDIIKPFQDGSLSSEEAMNIGLTFVTALALTYILKEFFIWIRLKKMSILGEKVARDLRSDLFQHIQKLDMNFFSSKQTGSIISRISSDTDRIWDFVAFGIVEVAISLVTLLCLTGVLISLDTTLGLIMTIPVPLLIFSIFKHGQRMQNLFLRCWRKWSDITSVLSDAIPGIQVVKSFNQEEKEISRFEGKNTVATNQFMNVHEAWAGFWPKLMISIHFVMIAVWVFALPRLMTTTGSAEHISVGVFVSFLLYMTMFAAPIEVIGQMARMLNRATSSAYRIFEILDTKSSIIDSENSVEHSLKGEIEFKNVGFSYDGVRKVLKGVSCKVQSGEMIGLVGPSGSGKSTMIKLINRFYDTSSGQILIDGYDVRQLDKGKLRKQIAVVHQEPFLFHGSIIDNIRYGNEDADLIDVIEAARIANAHEFILKFKDGYETVIGERGQTLSGGERQRLSIARAVLNDPKLLILDEATSAVDTETERKIQDALDKLVEGRTVIAIAHRLSTLRKADRIIVVKSGEIVEEGKHHELMELNGEYRKLQDMQTEMHNLMRGKEESKEVQNVV